MARNIVVPRGPYPKGVRRREEILDRALEVFDRAGFKATSLRAVGESIGVTHAALRHYFHSSDDLLLAVLRRADDRAEAGFDVTDASATAEFAARLATASMRLPGLTALYATMAARALESQDTESRAFFVERYRRVRAFALLALQHSRDQGAIRDDVPLETAAALLVAAADGLSTQWLIDPTADMHEGLRLLEQLLRPHGNPGGSRNPACSRSTKTPAALERVAQGRSVGKIVIAAGQSENTLRP